MKVSESGSLTNEYSNFIAISRYARWLENDGRRETWAESVQRYIDFMKTQLGDKIDDNTLDRIHNGILNQDIMPSMRALMTAGPALERENIAAYNCSFIAVDSLRSFDEALYILMNGTGVGFSVESKYVSKLPIISDSFVDSETVIFVEDSKMGWAKAYKELIGLLVQGIIPKWDMSRVRPAGARLKTFGGRSSGPEPLDRLFRQTVSVFKNAAGRQLSSVECHDIMCHIAEIVVVGGVRRAALISMSDLDDYGMATAKSGSWWENNGQRGLANNSAVYHKKPTMGQFMEEWKNLYDSKSGERGIINMDSIRNHIDGFGRRDSSLVGGVNPCLSADSLLLNEDGWVTFGEAYLSGETQRIIQDGRVTYHASDDGLEHPDNWKIDSHASRGVITQSSEVKLTQKNADLVKLDTVSGLSVRLTPDHLVATKRGMVEAGKLKDGEQILVAAAPLTESIVGRMPETIDEHMAFLCGLIAGDGTFSRNKFSQIAHVDLWGDDRWLCNQVVDSIMTLHEHYGPIIGMNSREYAKPYVSVVNESDKIRISSSYLAYILDRELHFNADTKHCVPENYIKFARHTPAKFYVAALAFCDGTVNKYNKIGSSSIRINQSNRSMLADVNLILLANGIVPRLYLRSGEGYRSLSDGHGGVKEYLTKENYESVIMMHAYEYTNIIGFIGGHKQVLAEQLFTAPSKKQNTYDTVASVILDGNEDVYCLQENTRRTLVANGITMRRCGEIILRPNELCNLTEVVIAPDDTFEDIKSKVELATILGTYQATLTNFKYVRKSWQKNCEEERLLGVSFTGIFGNELFSSNNSILANNLDQLREYALEVNAIWADRFSINRSAAITCVKPSGTVSQLTGVSSGIHPWYSQYYVRTVRADNKDPLTRLMKDEGIPNEPDVTNPDDITVFSFPIAAPANAVTSSNLTAIQHLELWKTYREHWTEHNPSVTINVRESEWMEVGAWVYNNFDHIGGVSFLPYSDHTYKQAPYQPITKEEYDGFEFPNHINWDYLPVYELSDTTTGSQELSCVSGSCDIVDLVK